MRYRVRYVNSWREYDMDFDEVVSEIKGNSKGRITYMPRQKQWKLEVFSPIKGHDSTYYIEEII